MDKHQVHTVVDVIERAPGLLKPRISFSKIKARQQGHIPLAPSEGITKAPIPHHVTSDYRWAMWGGYDNLPTIIRQKICDVPIAGRTIHDLVKMMYGNGIAYYRNEDRHKGNSVQRHYSPEIERFLRRNHIHQKWLIPQLYDYRYTVNSFSELIFNRRRDQVTGLFTKGAEFSRLSMMDEHTPDIEYLYFSPQFAMSADPTDKEIRKIPLYQWYDEESFLENLPGFKMAWHSCLETPGRIYYATAPWIGLYREDGWMDVSKAVPEVVSSMMYNQVRLKYQILIPESYFTVRYRNSWSTMTDEARGKIIDDLIKEIDDSLSGTENAYISIATVFNYDAITQQEVGKIEIIAIDDKVKKDSWVPSAEKSDAQIVQGLGGHVSHIGLAPESGKMGSGSGSDKREMYNMEISTNTLEQEIILQPLNWIAEFNSRINPEWDVTFYIDHTHHTTTNHQEDGLERDPNSNITAE